MIGHIPELVEAGMDSLKIEGRMKTALYVATVARTYRKALDDYQESPEKYREHMPWYQEQISNCTYRQFTTGFFFGRPDENTQIYDESTYVKEYTYLGTVGETRDGLYRIEQRNKFSVGEQIESRRARPMRSRSCMWIWKGRPRGMISCGERNRHTEIYFRAG